MPEIQKFEKLSSLGTELKLSYICSARRYGKKITMSGVIAVNATRQRKQYFEQPRMLTYLKNMT